MRSLICLSGAVIWCVYVLWYTCAANLNTICIFCIESEGLPFHTERALCQHVNFLLIDIYLCNNIDVFQTREIEKKKTNKSNDYNILCAADIHTSYILVAMVIMSLFVVVFSIWSFLLLWLAYDVFRQLLGRTFKFSEWRYILHIPTTIFRIHMKSDSQDNTHFNVVFNYLFICRLFEGYISVYHTILYDTK